MREVDFKIEGDYIELIKLLKAAHVTVSGAEAKQKVDSGAVLRNDEIESRKRAKILRNEVIVVDGEVTIRTL
ncbi:MAG: RNA-binding S4 domain-containing protein [Rikenellaceae bacterium]